MWCPARDVPPLWRAPPLRRTTKTAVLQKIDPRIVMRLEQSEGKHLLLNMSKDLLQTGVLQRGGMGMVASRWQ